MSCSQARANRRLSQIPHAKYRKVEIKCCLVEMDDELFKIPEGEAIEIFSPTDRIYYMDGESYGNLLKNVKEGDGIIRQYENYPCVEQVKSSKD